MVILYNIKKNSMGIECDYNPEKSGHLGHIVLKKNGDTEIEYSRYEYGKKTYAQKTIDELTKLSQKNGVIPNKTAVTWY